MGVAGIEVAVGMADGVGVTGIRVSVGIGVFLSAVTVVSINASTDLTAATLHAETKQIPNKMTSLTEAEIPFKWNEMYLINKYQDRWYPLWGAYKKTNLVIDPLGIEIRPFKIDSRDQPDARIYFGDNGYLRAIFRLPRDNHYYYLAFADLPLIEINYEDD